MYDICMYVCTHHRGSVGQVSRDDADEIASRLIPKLLHLRAQRHGHLVRMHRLGNGCKYTLRVLVRLELQNMYVCLYVCMYEKSYLL